MRIGIAACNDGRAGRFESGHCPAQRILSMLTALLVATHLLAAPLLAADPPAAPAKPAPTANDAASPTGSLALSMRTLDQAGLGTVTLDATNVTIEELFQKLQSFAGLPLRIDWSALSRMGVAKDDRLDFHIKDVPPLVAVKAITNAMDAEIDRPVVDASAGQIVVTSPNGLASLRELAIYDVADILADPTLIDAIAAAAAEREAPAKEDPATEPDAKPDEKPDSKPEEKPTANTVAEESPLHARTERLIEIITEHIDPEGWLDSGGSRGRITGEAGRLIVTATPMAHRQLTQLLATLREQAPLSATITCTIAALPNAALNEALAKPTADRRAAVAAVRGSPGFRIVAAPRLVAQLGQAATVELKDGNASTLCRATPTFDRARRSLSVAVRAELTSGDRHAAIESSIGGAAAGFTDLLRLAGGPSATETFVIIVEAATDPRQGADR